MTTTNDDDDRMPESIRTEAAAASSALLPELAGYCVVVMSSTGVFVAPLRQSGDSIVGRGDTCDVRIDDTKASRRHVVLRVNTQANTSDANASASASAKADANANATAVVDVIDLGSMNGTLLGGRRLTPNTAERFAVGDTISIGATSLTLQRARADASFGAGGGGGVGAQTPPPTDEERARLARPLESTDAIGSGGQLDHLIERVAGSTINVLILGETGVGKEVMARTLHERSPRAKAPLVCINCAALTESLLESELFGYERGAFTGAVQAKPGLLEAANGGTAFLDEIGEMPLTLQAKMLRVLEQREVQRIGALRPTPIDVRLLFATNRDLEEEIRQGRFRSDLWFRVNGIAIAIPPLRERRGEIESLARSFVERAANSGGNSGGNNVPSLSPEVITLLHAYAWPGNVRELRNVMERAVVLCTGGVITLEHLPLGAMTTARAVSTRSAPESDRDHIAAAPASAPTSETSETSAANEDQENDEVPADILREPDERRRIQMALERCDGNQTRAAKMLGISRRTLVSRLGDYDMPRPRKK